MGEVLNVLKNHLLSSDSICQILVPLYHDLFFLSSVLRMFHLTRSSTITYFVVQVMLKWLVLDFQPSQVPYMI